MVTIAESHIIVNGVCYFRGNAEAVALGSLGRKETPLFGVNYLEVESNIGLVGVPMEPVLAVEVEQESTKHALIQAKARIPSLNVEAGFEATHESVKSAKLRLVRFGMTLESVRKNAIDDETMRDLEAIGGRARVAYHIWVAMLAEEAAEFTNNVDISAAIGMRSVTITASGRGGASRVSRVKLSQGSTFAYLLARRRQDGYFTTDQHGLS